VRPRSVFRIVAAVALLASCSPPPPRSLAERTITDRERGCRYVVPERWLSFDGEMRTTSGSNLSIHVYELTGAEPRFVERLPDSLVPQLLEWAKYYFVVDGPGQRVFTKVGGLNAFELTYAVRVRADDPPTKTTYWVIRRGSRLHVLRAAYAWKTQIEDERAVREAVGTWEFVEPAPLASPLPEGPLGQSSTKR
jgi:hypothetical protein